MIRGADVFVMIAMLATRLSDPVSVARETKIQRVRPERANTGYGIPGIVTFARCENANV